jgi:hypothetical protein
VLAEVERPAERVAVLALAEDADVNVVGERESISLPMLSARAFRALITSLTAYLPSVVRVTVASSVRLSKSVMVSNRPVITYWSESGVSARR